MRLAVALLLVAAGCSFDPIDLTGKGCPCSPGWVCDETADVCMPREPRDGGIDAWRKDGDAPLPDAETDGQADRPDAGRDAGLDAGIDAGLDAGMLDETSCDDAHAGTLLCDGFEEGAGFTAWTMDRGAAYVSDPRYRGAFAMRATSTPTAAIGYLYEQFEPVGSGELYMRAYLYLPSGADATRLSILHLEQGGAPYDYAEVRLEGGDLVAVARYADMHTPVSAGPMPRDRWTCVEMRLLIAAAGEIELSVDGVSAGTASAVTLLTTEYRTFYAGISYRDQTGDADLYFDEVVLSTTPVGCD